MSPRSLRDFTTDQFCALIKAEREAHERRRQELERYRDAFRKLARLATPEYLAKVCAEFGVKL